MSEPGFRGVTKPFWCAPFTLAGEPARTTGRWVNPIRPSAGHRKWTRIDDPSEAT